MGRSVGCLVEINIPGVSTCQGLPMPEAAGEAGDLAARWQARADLGHPVEENPLGVQKNVKNVVIKNLWWVFHIKVLVYRRDLVALLSYSGNFLHSYGNQWLCRATRGSVGLRPRKLQADSAF